MVRDRGKGVEREIAFRRGSCARVKLSSFANRTICALSCRHPILTIKGPHECLEDWAPSSVLKSSPLLTKASLSPPRPRENRRASPPHSPEMLAMCLQAAFFYLSKGPSVAPNSCPGCHLPRRRLLLTASTIPDPARGRLFSPGVMRMIAIANDSVQ